MDNVLKNLQKNLSLNDTIILCVSGGVDSMSLMHIIISNLPNLKVICAHVNHNVRKESEIEYNYLKNYCSVNNIIFESMKIEQKLDANFEAEARKIRYTFFNELKEKYQAKYIVTAHHGDDLIETILMRIARGSNLHGYMGIKMIEKDYFRPLINVSKDEIISYATLNNIKYFEDYTNHEEIHTRNKYRKNVLPFLKRQNSNIHLKYFQFSKELEEYENFVNNYIDSKFDMNRNYLSISKLKKESVFIQKKVISNYIHQIQQYDILEIANTNMEEILKLIDSNKPNGYLNLNNNFVVQKSYDKLTIEKKRDYEGYCYKFEKEIIIDNWKITTINQSEEKSNYILRLNSDEIHFPLYFRNIKTKDLIEAKNLGHKKIKDIFIDFKIVKDERKRYPILVDSNDTVLWIPGLKKSKFDKDKNEKYDIILYSERIDNNDKCKEE